MDSESPTKAFAKSDEGILGSESAGVDELFVIDALAGNPFSEVPNGMTVTWIICQSLNQGFQKLFKNLEMKI